MSFALILRSAAQDDIDDAAVWYEVQREGLGFRFADEVGHVLDQIREMPARFPAAEKTSVRRAFLRKFPYAVYFQAEESQVVVLAVLHMRRHPDTWKGRT